MAISAGDTISAGDFVSTSSGASDEGKVAKLNADGRIPRDFLFRTAQTRLTLSGNYTVVNNPIPWDTEDYDDGTDALHDNTAPYDMVAISQNSMTGYTASYVWYAQKIVTGANDYLISRLKVYLESAGSTQIRVTIRSSLSGSDLYDSGDQGAASPAWLTINNVGLHVSPNTTYYIVVHRRTGDNYKLGYNSTAPYSSGGFYTSSGGDGYTPGTWSGEDTSKDMALEVQIDNRPIVRVQQDGYYLVTAQLPSGDATNTKVATLYKNTTVIGFSGSELVGGESESNELLTITKCVAGDILYINVTVSYGSPSVASSGASFCVFRIA